MPLGTWEFNTVVDDNPDEPADRTSTCCTTPAAVGTAAGSGERLPAAAELSRRWPAPTGAVAAASSAAAESEDLAVEAKWPVGAQRTRPSRYTAMVATFGSRTRRWRS